MRRHHVVVRRVLDEIVFGLQEVQVQLHRRRRPGATGRLVLLMLLLQLLLGVVELQLLAVIADRLVVVVVVVLMLVAKDLALGAEGFEESGWDEALEWVRMVESKF